MIDTIKRMDKEIKICHETISRLDDENEILREAYRDMLNQKVIITDAKELRSLITMGGGTHNYSNTIADRVIRELTSKG